jgi:MSHA biogenesis protein MshP
VSAHHAQRGFSLVAALFLIVVLATLGTFAIRAGLGQQQTVNLAVLGSRALEAARTGIEWGAQRALVGGVCANTTLNLTEGTLNGFTVQVTCVVTNHAEAGGTYQVYTFTSLAQSGVYGTNDYVSRSVRARFTNAP